MSPVNADNLDKTPRLSFLSEKFRASSVDTSSPPVPRSSDSLSRRDVHKRSSLCSGAYVNTLFSMTVLGR
jgi:hypothetical protein